MPSDRKKGVKYTKKRKYHGNQHSAGPSNAKKLCTESAVSVTGHSSTVHDHDSGDSLNSKNCQQTEDTPTTSEKKLLYMYSVMNEGENVDSNLTESTVPDDLVVNSVPVGNRIIDMTLLSNTIAEQLVCKFCHGRVTLIEVTRQGLDSELAFHCSSRRCNQQQSFHTSEQISVSNLSVCSMNRRSVLAMRTIGCDRAELSLFCGVMDLPQPVHKSSYNIINNTIEKAACSVQQQSMSDAAASEYSLSTPINQTELRNIDASSEIEMGLTPLEAYFTVGVQQALNPHPSRPVIAYRLPQGAARPNFGLISLGNGYVAKMRASMGNGEICGHDSALIPQNVRNDIIKTTPGTQGRNYNVTVTMRTDGDLLLPYFS